MLSPDVVLAERYQTRYNRLRLRAGLLVGVAWDRLAGLDDESADRFSVAAARTVGAAQAQTVAGVDGYVAAAIAITTGESYRPTEPIGPPRGVAALEVYRRGIVTARTKVSEGQSFFDAMGAGRSRMVATAQTDVALAQRSAMTRAVDGRRIVGYRRVLTGESCALCATASTQRYTRSDIAPIHGSCDCSVAPIIGDHDPGRVINQPLLDDLKAAGKASGDPDYWRSRKLTVAEDGTVRLPDIEVRHHGELGPVLTEKAHTFTSPADI